VIFKFNLVHHLECGRANFGSSRRPLPSPGRRSNFGRQVGEESNMLSSLLACAGLLTGPRIALCKGSYPAHPLVLSQTIEALAAGKKNGLACTPAESEELEEVISMLEAQSPTEAPAQSALLDGAWRLDVQGSHSALSTVQCVHL
jgi:hypothetical protein